MPFIFHESIHLFAGLIVFVVSYWLFRQKIGFWPLFFLVFGITFLLDVDHLFDLFLAHGKWRDFSSGYYFSTSNKAYVFLHSFELLIPVWLYALFSKKYYFGWIITFTLLAHLLVDQFSYCANPFTYFLTYRAINHFDLKILFRC